MLRKQGDALLLDGEITFANVQALLDESVSLLADGCNNIDFSGVTVVDSSAVSLAFEWQRRATAPLRFTGLPAPMLSLLKLYSATDLLPQ